MTGCPILWENLYVLNLCLTRPFFSRLAIILFLPSTTAALAQTDSHSSDFNGDGFDDLAIGIPGKVIDGMDFAGAIRVLSGSQEGLLASGSMLLRRGGGAPGSPTANERFGSVLTVGNFNGDKFADLATGTGSLGAGGGSVTVFYGSPAGLQGGVQDFPNQTTGGESPHFGSALAAGDFNDDGFDELAVGISRTGLPHAGGTVLVLQGGEDGLLKFPSGSGFNGILKGDLPGGRFGSALAAGHFNDDSFMDLAVGAPEYDERHTNEDRGGDVYVLFGSSEFLQAGEGRELVLNQNTNGVHDQKEPRDGFGSSLISGDLDGNGSDELVVGVGYEALGATSGAVHVFFASPRLSGDAGQFWHQGVDGLGGPPPTPGALFGSVLGAGDFDGDRRVDFVAGVPGGGVGAVKRPGVFHVVYGPPRETTARAPQFWHQDAFGLGHGLETGDGLAFGSGDFNGDGYQDLALGSRGEDLAGVSDAGGVIVLYGSRWGLSASESEFWAEHSLGFRSALGQTALFGASLSSAARKDPPKPLFEQPAESRHGGTWGTAEAPVTEAGVVPSTRVHLPPTRVPNQKAYSPLGSALVSTCRLRGTITGDTKYIDTVAVFAGDPLVRIKRVTLAADGTFDFGLFGNGSYRVLPEEGGKVGLVFEPKHRDIVCGEQQGHVANFHVRVFEG